MGFYKGEIRFRAEHGYPPYGQLARLVYQSGSNERAEQAAHMMARYLRRRAESLREEVALDDLPLYDADVIGPAPCFIHKVRNRFRWHILVRAQDVHPVLEGLDPGPGWSLDIDPLNLL
jgi:primosomal protein N' (replication factor Y)